MLLEFEIPEGEEIVGASIFFDRIRNWRTEPNDLWLTLMDSDFTGINIYRDDQAAGNYFDGLGLELEHYVNLSSTAQSFSYNFDDDEIDQLTLNLADDMAGIAFDPDCHFYNCGVKLTIETDAGGDEPPIAEPLAGSLLLAGVGTLVARRRR